VNRAGLIPWLIRGYARRRVRRGLDGVYARGLDQARDACAAGPMLVASNHVSWWDPMVLLLIEQALDVQGWGLMRADNLTRLPFFKHTGALPLDLENPRQAVRDLTNAAGVLDGPQKILWIFPQGEQRPMHLRPLGFKPGVSWLARKAGARVLPVSLHVAFDEQPVPRYFVDFGRPMAAAEVGERDGHLGLEAAVIRGLDELDHVGVDDLTALSASAAQNPERGLGARLLGAGATDG
jgi:1-acyl-sn-glycerol-3-phosphate acyltransferase